MRVFVAGGSGAIGRRLVPLLAGRGYEVTATTRTPERARLLESLGAHPAVVDGLDAGGMQAALAAARPDVVVHQMTALAGVVDFRRFAESFAPTNALRTRGTDALLDAAREAGARRVVAQSYFGLLAPEPPSSMRETVAALQHLERAVTTAPGLAGLVLRYGAFYGPGTSLAEDGEQVELVRKRRYPVIGDGAGVFSFVHVDDAARATLAAIESDETGVLDIVDDEPAPLTEWLPGLAEAVGAPPPRHVPVWLGRLLAGEAVVAMATRFRGAPNEEAKRVLGWQPRWPTWRDGFRRGLSEDGAWAAAA